MLRHVLSCRFIVIMKRSYLRSCTFVNRLTVCDPDCSLQDFRKALVGFLAALGPRAPGPNGLNKSDKEFALVVFRGVLQCPFPAAFVIQSQACLKSDTSHGHRSFLCQFPACCLLTNLKSAPPHSKMASSICGGFLARTLWYALYPLSLILDARAWFAASQSASNLSMSVLRARLFSSCNKSSFQSLPASSAFPFLHGCLHGVTSGGDLSLSVLSAKISVQMPRCLSTTRMRGLP